MNLEYEKRFSEYELTERFQPLADLVVSRYEEGEDISDRKLSHGNSLSIVDLDESQLIFGKHFNQDDKRVSWEFQSSMGRSYLANISIPRRVNLFMLIDGPYTGPGILLTILLFSWLLTFLLTGPIRQLQSHVQSLAEGELDTRLEGRIVKRKDEIGDLAKALDEMSERIQKLLDSKQRLLYDVSHELRAPLARMQVAAELVRSEAEQQGGKTELHDRVSQEIDTLNSIITELLQLARTENGGSKSTHTNLREPILAVVEDMRFVYGNPTISISQQGQPQTYKVDVNALKTAVKNILENALKYSPSDQPIEIEIVETAGDGEQIFIRDNGPGIPDDKLDAVLQPFTRLQSESIEGFGLGLSIAQRAVQSLGGQIKLNNRPERGLQVCISLKLTAD